MPADVSARGPARARFYQHDRRALLLAAFGRLWRRSPEDRGAARRSHARADRRCGTATAPTFGHLNAGKKSVVLDLKSDDGRRAALVAGGDQRRRAGEFSPGRDGAARARLRDARRGKNRISCIAQFPASARAGRVPATCLRADHPCRERVRSDPVHLSGRSGAAGQDRRLHRRRAGARLRLRRDPDRLDRPTAPRTAANTSTLR